MSENILNLPEKPRTNKLYKTLIFIVVFSLIIWARML